MEDLDKVLESKRHKEILTTLQGILTSMKEESKEQSILLIDDDIKNSLKNIEKNLNNQELSLFLKNLSIAWAKALDKIKPDPAQNWTFDIIRDGEGYIKSVKATKN